MTHLMTDEQLDALALDLPGIKAWIAAVEKDIEKALKDGATFTNAELVPKRANRAWQAGLDVLALLRKFSKLDVVAPRVPLSPSAAEKTLGKSVYSDGLAKFVVRESSGMKLAYKSTEVEEKEE